MSYLVRTPRIPLFMLTLIGLEAKGLLAFQGRRESASVVRWNLRPVIFGVDKISEMPILGFVFSISGCFFWGSRIRACLFGIFRGNSGSGHLEVLYQVATFLNFGWVFQRSPTLGCLKIILRDLKDTKE